MLSTLIVVFVILIPVGYYLLKPSSLPSIPNATPNLPLLGNTISFGLDPIQFLLTQRTRHGDIFLVNLVVFKLIFFLGPEGTNAIFKGTDRSGISFLSAMTYIIGPTLEKGTMQVDQTKIGLAVPGWAENGRPIMQMILADPENITYWTRLIRPLVRERFNLWAETGEDVSLFRGISDLVMTALFYLFLGDEFAMRHASELVPMVRAYEKAMQTPQTKVLPRWMSREGVLLDTLEDHFKSLCDKEINRRLSDMDKFRGNKDYLQLLLNAVGGTFAEGTLQMTRIT
jgi:hypothetical protein